MVSISNILPVSDLRNYDKVLKNCQVGEPVWNDYVVLYKVGKEAVEIYRVINRYQDITTIF